MNDSIRLHRDRCKDESFLARADRGGVATDYTQRLGILESRRGLSFLSLDYRDTLAVSTTEGRGSSEITTRNGVAQNPAHQCGFSAKGNSRYQARPDCNSFIHNEQVTPTRFGLRKQAETVAESVCADEEDAGQSGVTAGRDRQTLSASANGLAPKPMMAPDRGGELVSRFGHAGCGGNPHALNLRSVKPENDRAGKASRSADRLVNVNPSHSAVRGITDTAIFSEESVQLRHSPQGRAKTRLGCWCNRARRNNIPPVAQRERVLVF